MNSGVIQKQNDVSPLFHHLMVESFQDIFHNFYLHPRFRVCNKIHDFTKLIGRTSDIRFTPLNHIWFTNFFYICADEKCNCDPLLRLFFTLTFLSLLREIFSGQSFKKNIRSRPYLRYHYDHIPYKVLLFVPSKIRL